MHPPSARPPLQACSNDLPNLDTTIAELNAENAKFNNLIKKCHEIAEAKSQKRQDVNSKSPSVLEQMRPLSGGFERFKNRL